jgi:PAS domain S-box-containing protein
MRTADLWEQIEVTFHRGLSSSLGRYGFVLLAVGAAATLQLGLQLSGFTHLPYAFFVPLLVVVPLLVGFGPGIMATVLSTVVGGYFLFSPVNAKAHPPEDLARPALFLIAGTVITTVTAGRARTKQALRVTESDLTRAQAVAQIGSWSFDFKDGNVNLSDGAKRILGLPKHSEILPMQAREMVCAEDRARVEAAWQEALESGMYDQENRVLLNGQTRWLRIQASLERDASGQATKANGTVQDVTEWKLAQQRLQEYEKASEGLEEMILVIDRDYRYVIANRAFLDTRGVEREQLIGRPLLEMMGAEAFGNVKPKLEECLHQGKIVNFEKRSKLSRYGERDFAVSYLPLAGPMGVERIAIVMKDITQRKQAESALRESEERFRVALKHSPVTVFNQDRDLRYTWIYNPHLYIEDAVIGKTDEEILGKKAAQVHELKRRVLETGVSVREEIVISHEGNQYAFDLAIEPLFDAEKKIIGITGASMDVARQRDLADTLRDAKDRLAQEKSYLEHEIETELGFEEIIGQSAPLREVLKKARIVAPIDSTVLILGESGTGKELVARAVHGLSTRREKNFIKLNCAAVPSGLLESELFGHERGAFTGAVSQKIGRVELADKGTLFLDEIGELPLELQPKLLRLLQDREFERLGGVQTLHVDVRIISATNRDLQQDVADRKFREDLFYRLNVFPIEMPTLRERRSDIPMLVHHFVLKHSTRMGKHIEVIPKETIKVLENWNWPGNIRELENMIERMVILSSGPTLAAPPEELSAPQSIAEDDFAEMEREHIMRILRETNGVLAGPDGAAARLGLKRTTLQSMLKRFGIEPREYRRATGTFGTE